MFFYTNPLSCFPPLPSSNLLFSTGYQVPQTLNSNEQLRVNSPDRFKKEPRKRKTFVFPFWVSENDLWIEQICSNYLGWWRQTLNPTVSSLNEISCRCIQHFSWSGSRGLRTMCKTHSVQPPGAIPPALSPTRLFHFMLCPNSWPGSLLCVSYFSLLHETHCKLLAIPMGSAQMPQAAETFTDSPPWSNDVFFWTFLSTLFWFLRTLTKSSIYKSSSSQLQWFHPPGDTWHCLTIPWLLLAQGEWDWYQWHLASGDQGCY